MDRGSRGQSLDPIPGTTFSNGRMALLVNIVPDCTTGNVIALGAVLLLGSRDLELTTYSVVTTKQLYWSFP